MVIAAALSVALFLAGVGAQGEPIDLDAWTAAAVAEICRRLDGLPLALELAAARSSLLGLTELRDRLGPAIDVLGGGPRDLPDRQRTLRATIEWSHDLLEPGGESCVRRVRSLRGRCDRGGDGRGDRRRARHLAALVDKHLLLRRDGPDGQSRVAMLETVREFAAERLEGRADAETLHARHCSHYLALAERADPELLTHGEAEWLPRLDADVENVPARPLPGRSSTIPPMRCGSLVR